MRRICKNPRCQRRGRRRRYAMRATKNLACGTIVNGLESVDEVGERIFRLMLATASGAATKSELHGYGQNEFVPWQLGAVM
jgi:altronate dehydratase